MEVRDFSKIGSSLEVPDLNAVQRRSYEDFLQRDRRPTERENTGLEAVIREVFPIENEDGDVRLDYVYYTLGEPRFTPDECRRLELTYGYPFRVRVRLKKEDEIQEQDVYLGEMPAMLGGGEFIVNGSERVIVTQLHRAPGCDFSVEKRGDSSLYSCRIIPERGSWVEMETSRRDQLGCRLDRSSKMPATLLLKALSEEHASDEAILKLFYPTEDIKFTEGTAAARLRDRISAERIAVDDDEMEIVGAGEVITDDKARQLAEAGVESIEVLPEGPDPLILETLDEDDSSDHRSAVKELYSRLRPGTPFNFEKARQTLWDKFFDPDRYQLGKVGRFRMNRKFGDEVPEDHQTLRYQDIVNAIRYLMELRSGRGQVDDIDHLGNRRVRTIGEICGDSLRRGFLRMRRTVEERVNLKDPSDFTPRSLVNSKAVSAAIDYFFGRGDLSQVADQTNPLAQLTHERRLSALGPGGLNRKRAGFEVRDVHISHYGRICPIETPEGTNIGLITSLGIYTNVDEFGFLVTPYQVVRDGEPTDEIHYLRADQEEQAYIAPSDVQFGDEVDDADTSASDAPHGEEVNCRYMGDTVQVPREKVQYRDVSPSQIMGVSASLIPFLEHSDANRALMGSNMQRQAVPLIQPEKPLIGTGVEPYVAQNSGLVVRAEEDETVEDVDARRIETDKNSYELRKFVGLNQRTCLNQRPRVEQGEEVEEGEILADGAATDDGELALGQNLLTAFMPWEGYNFEDAVLISENVVKDDKYTSIHVEGFETEIRETKLGKEEFTRDIPNTPKEQLSNLDEDGIVREGTWVEPGDILVGKVAPKSRSELSPEEKLLYAIFGKAGEDVRNESLTVPSGTEGVVVRTEKFSRRSYLGDEEREKLDKEISETKEHYNERIANLFRKAVTEMEEVVGGPLVDSNTGEDYSMDENNTDNSVVRTAEKFDPRICGFGGELINEKVLEVYGDYEDKIDDLKSERDRKLSHINRGDELPSGVLEMVKVYVATKRKLCEGDKMAGRHGNKGVIAEILPEEDMPFLPDGTPVDIVLNPLGVPSRMNVGQILETHLGWAASELGFRALSPVFDGATEEEIRECLRDAGLPEDGKTELYDGRTGETFDQEVTVGYMYMMKLDHLVEDKVHARATGPYSLITQQPLGGKARYGGQRFGEMEVWALEAYGAAYTLQELLTVKSDDVEGRSKIYESTVKGQNLLEAGIPSAFEVLCNEIRGLGLNIELQKGTM